MATNVLQLGALELATLNLQGLEEHRIFSNELSSSLVALDQQAGNVTASFTTAFTLSGTVSDFVGQTIGMSYAPAGRVIQEVVAFAQGSGSGAVTRLDVLVQDSGGVFNSIFSNNIYKPKVSASLGNYGINAAQTLRTSSWDAGKILRVDLEAAAVLQANLHVVVKWKPSGSYGI